MAEGDYSTRHPPFSLFLWRQFFLKRVKYSYKRKGLILICVKPIKLRIVVYSLQRIVATGNYYLYCFLFFLIVNWFLQFREPRIFSCSEAMTLWRPRVRRPIKFRLISQSAYSSVRPFCRASGKERRLLGDPGTLGSHSFLYSKRTKRQHNERLRLETQSEFNSYLGRRTELRSTISKHQ